jgi:hypothetical protein
MLFNKNTGASQSSILLLLPKVSTLCEAPDIKISFKESLYHYELKVA